MGHDIMGFNKKGEEKAYARYSMSNPNSTLLYKALNSMKHNCGVSGCGDERDFTVEQVEKAIEFAKKLKKHDFDEDSDYPNYERDKLNDFLKNCLQVAKKEGKVRILFG